MVANIRRVVVSAVNFTEGGPLTVLLECLSSAAEVLEAEWEIIALTHSETIFTHPRVRIIAFPESKKSWGKRLALEWGGGFMKLSKDLRPDLWLSLHDITPRVCARRQVVYCHNPAPFYKLNCMEARLEPSFALFNFFYSFLYRAFIGRNELVVVQQQWLRDEFKTRYQHPCVVVAHPQTRLNNLNSESFCNLNHVAEEVVKPFVFLYPALPRVFKNFETVCEAMAKLPAHIGHKVDLRLTIDGSENAYAAHIVKKYSDVSGLSFVGKQNRSQMIDEYSRCDAVVFPSRLETWGLPITEAKNMGKSLLVADLPYARETVGDYAKVSFLPSFDAGAWAVAIQKMVEGDWKHAGQIACIPESPYVEGWAPLWRLLTEGL